MAFQKYSKSKWLIITEMVIISIITIVFVASYAGSLFE